MEKDIGAYKTVVHHATAVCSSAYSKLKPKEKKHVDDFLNAAFALYVSLQPWLTQVRSLQSVSQCVSYLNSLSTFLERKEVHKTIMTYLHMYADTLENKERLKTYRAYLQCFLHSLEQPIQDIVNAVFKLIVALIKIYTHTSSHEATQTIRHNLLHHVFKPVLLSKKK